MSNYYLVSKKIKEIDFTKTPHFSELEYKKLPSIVNFTSCFENEQKLKEYLLAYNLITEEDMKNKLSIMYKYNKKEKYLMYGLTYKKDRKFFDVKYILNYIKSNINNIELLEKLCNHYRNSYIQGNNISMIRNYTNYIKYNENYIENDLINSILITIDYFVNMEVYNPDKKIKYKNLRDLAMFLSYNDNSKEKNEEKPKTKQLKKSKNIDGQITLKDIGWI